MDQYLQPIKDVFETMTALGWLPIPLAVSAVTMLALRIAYEPSVLTVSTKEELSRMGWIKIGIFIGVACVTLLMQFGLQRPENGFDRALAIGFSLGDVMFAYVLTSSQRVKSLIKIQFSPAQDPEKL